MRLGLCGALRDVAQSARDVLLLAIGLEVLAKTSQRPVQRRVPLLGVVPLDLQLPSELFSQPRRGLVQLLEAFLDS